MSRFGQGHPRPRVQLPRSLCNLPNPATAELSHSLTFCYTPQTWIVIEPKGTIASPKYWDMKGTYDTYFPTTYKIIWTPKLIPPGLLTWATLLPGLFKIIKNISPYPYQIELPLLMKYYNIFHILLLEPTTDNTYPRQNTEPPLSWPDMSKFIISNIII
jgi:hypothetical protein